MTMRRSLWLSLLGLICLCGLALRWAQSREPIRHAQADYLLLADNLISHRTLGENDRPTAFRSVLFPAVIALTREGWSPLRLPFPQWQALISAAAIPAAALLGLLVRSPLGGLLAALLVAVDPDLAAAVPSYNIEPFFGLLVLAVCAAVLCWNEKPGPRRAGLAGACIALSLLCRSSLFLLPPFLLAASAAIPALGRLRRGWAVLLAASYLPLAPWVARNYWHSRSFTPFEQGAADRNLYAASLGFLENIDGYGYQDVLAGRLDTAPLDSAGPAARIRDLAREEISQHPLSYAFSTMKRFVLSLRLHWLSWALAVLLLFWRRREAGPALLAAVALYFFAVHSPMSWEARYFDPVLPCLYTLAGCALAEALGRAARRLSAASREGRKSADSWRPAFPRRLAPALAVSCAALYLLATGYLAAEAAWGLLPCRMPESTLSLLRCAQQKLARGRDLEAAAGLERARRLERPDTHPELRARVLISQAFLGARLAPAAPPAQARSLLEQAVAVSSNTVRKQAIALQDQGQFRQAALLFDVLVARDPRRAYALTIRGTGRVLAGDARSALEDLSQAVALDPSNIAAHLNLGALLESQGRCREALPHYRLAVQAAEELPEDQIPGYYLALARYYRDRLEQGRGPASCSGRK
jgi:tetratricopeptide (TPR) repeat protein